MSRKPRLIVFALLCATACTDASLEVPAGALSGTDNHLTLQGTVCTQPPDPTGFPVKVVFLVDQSGSMCVSDPPGSQNNTGFCEQAAVQAIVPPGVTQPARVRAIETLLNQWGGTPNVQVALVPFETSVHNVWPVDFSGGGATASYFGPANSSQLVAYLDQLQNQLGAGTDYQGALAYTYSLIANDISQTAASNPALLPRTRYVIVFLTDGTPYPRCTANPNLPVYADADHPWLTWPDSPDAVDFCNTYDPANYPPAGQLYGGFVPGTDRNQNYQLFDKIDEIMSLKQTYNIGDIRLDTVLLFNEAAVAACGTLCVGLYGFPAPDAEKIAQWLLGQMAMRGNGVFQEFANSQIYGMGLGGLDYASLASPNVMKTLILQSLTTTPADGRQAVDADGDGLPDSTDNSFTYGTSQFDPDTDGDCFDDGFEVRHVTDGFSPMVKDLRGCDPSSPRTLGCVCADTDGDGLSQYAEGYLKTDPTLMDTDHDGIPDGLEARFGLDPTKPNTGLDSDGDGIGDLDEIRAGTNPSQQDKDLYTSKGYVYSTQSHVQNDGSVCYDFTISNINMVTPPAHAGQLEGFNLFKLYFAEAPQSGIATDYGNWKTACIWSQYAPPGVRVPAGPSLQLQDTDFHDPSTMTSMSQYIDPTTGCVGQLP